MLTCAAHKEQPSTAQRERLELTYTKAAQVSAEPLVKQGLTGNDIHNELNRLRIESIKASLANK